MTSQPPQDWTEGVEDLGGGIWRIPLPLPSDALRAVNVYAIADGAGALSMIDAGWALELSEQQLITSLAGIGFGLSDVEQFLVTHSHRDHYSQAITVRRKFPQISVGLGIGEQPNLEFIAEMDAGTATWGMPAFIRRCGAAELADRIALTNPMRGEGERDKLEEPDYWLADSQPIDIGRRRLTAIATPGHTRGHVVFSDAKAGLLFAGDHVLPHITPSIGLEPSRVPYPLRDYIASLKLLLSMPDSQMLPAHGPTAASVHHRVHELLSHHDRRLDATADAVAAGAATSFEVAQILTWTRRERKLSELDDFNSMLAIAETKSHLDVLVLQKRLTMTDTDAGIDIYEQRNAHTE